MTHADHKYRNLERRLCNLRSQPDCEGSSQSDDIILEEMGDLWWEMTDREQRLANRRARIRLEKAKQRLCSEPREIWCKGRWISQESILKEGKQMSGILYKSTKLLKTL
jgi:hypothetical protein